MAASRGCEFEPGLDCSFLKPISSERFVRLTYKGFMSPQAALPTKCFLNETSQKKFARTRVRFLCEPCKVLLRNLKEPIILGCLRRHLPQYGTNCCGQHSICECLPKVVVEARSIFCFFFPLLYYYYYQLLATSSSYC